MQCFRLARRFSDVGSSPDFSREPGVSRALSRNLFLTGDSLETILDIIQNSQSYRNRCKLKTLSHACGLLAGPNLQKLHVAIYETGNIVTYES